MSIHTEPANAGHPDLDLLLAYRAGDLTGDETSRLQDHLVECRECADLLLEAAAFDDPETLAPRVSDIERETAWRSLRRGLPRALRTPLLMALAALLIATVGVSIWMLRGQSATPTPGVTALGPIYDVYSVSRVRSGTREPEPIVFPPGIDQVTVILHPETPSTFPSYGAAVEVPGAASRWVENLYRNTAGGCHLGLSRDAVTDGAVSIRLFGVTEGAKTEMDRFELPVSLEP